jgi:hypothetical protein
MKMRAWKTDPIHQCGEVPREEEGQLMNFEEGDRQLVLLAIAELSLSRPGWDYALGLIADQLQGREMYDEFKRLNADRVKAERTDLVPH